MRKSITINLTLIRTGAKMKTKTFKVEVDGAEKEFLVKNPSLHDQREAQKVYNQAFTDAVKSKSVVRAKLEDLLKDQGLWDDDKQVKFDTLQRELLDGEKKLAKGGFPDLSGDGKVTQKDVLMGRGAMHKGGMYAAGGYVTDMMGKKKK